MAPMTNSTLLDSRSEDKDFSQTLAFGVLETIITALTLEVGILALIVEILHWQNKKRRHCRQQVYELEAVGPLVR